jgi:hypothetical protein
MKHYNVLCAVLTALPALLFSSCSDDPISGKAQPGDNAMQFSSSIKADETVASRGSKFKGKYSSLTAEKCNNSDMYILTGVEDQIDYNQLDAKAVEDAMSRSALITDTNIGEKYSGSGIGYYAYTYDARYDNFEAAANAGADITRYINNGYLTISKANDEGTAYNLSPRHREYWTSKSYKMSLYAVFPSVDDYASMSVDFGENTTDPTLDVTLESSIEHQRDFMVSKVEGILGDGSSVNNTVNFGLKHIMTAVSVSLGTGFTNKYISSVKFNNVLSSNKYHVLTNKWETTGKSASNTGDCHADFSTSVNPISSLKDANEYFMMLPQVLDENCTIEVTVCEKGQTEGRTYYATIGLPEAQNTVGSDGVRTKEWVAGKTFNYVISTTPEDVDYVIEPELTTMYFSYNGSPAGDGDNGTVNGENRSDLGLARVKSFKIISTPSANGGAPTERYEQLAWTAQPGENGSIITQYPASSNDATAIAGAAANAYTTEFKPKISVQSKTMVDSQDRTLLKQRASQKTLGTAANPIDLSKVKSDGTYWNSSQGQYSANCYMINYPGYYEIPVTHGCALYNSSTNASFYSLSSQENTSSYAMGTLKDYKNINISSAWINYWKTTTDYHNFPANDGKGASGDRDTYIVWEDTPNLVKLTYNYSRKTSNSETENYYIRFHVDNDANLKPGNAVIAVKNDDGVILWSYHIWVTSYTTNDTFSAQTTPLAGSLLTTAKFLKVPLGYVEEDYETYQERSAVLTLTQVESGKTVDITLKQKYHECRPQSCCYYQWGRKDPFPGAKIYESGHLNIDDSYEIKYEEKTLYNSDLGITGVLKASASGKTEVSWGIQNPATFFYGHRYPDYNYWDLWGCLKNVVSEKGKEHYTTSEAGVSGRKTVYDPSPAGFKVPPIYALPPLTSDGYNYTSAFSPFILSTTPEEEIYASKANTTYTSHDQFVNSMAFEFYTNRMANGVKSGDTFKIFAFGQRLSLNTGGTGGELTRVGQYGYYWSSTRWTSGSGTTNTRLYALETGYSGGASMFQPAFSNTDTYGFPVLPMVGN